MLMIMLELLEGGEILIIDTDVIIWNLRGNLNAKKIINKNIPFSISVVTYMELV